MYGIDAPEKTQPFGNESTNILSEIIQDRDIIFHIIEKDRYGRNVAIVSFAGSHKTVQSELLEKGAAWYYGKYCKLPILCTVYFFQAVMAKMEKIGLWADEEAIQPWTWRKAERG